MFLNYSKNTEFDIDCYIFIKIIIPLSACIFYIKRIAFKNKTDVCFLVFGYKIKINTEWQKLLL